jgi:hypothetical protein
LAIHSSHDTVLKQKRSHFHFARNRSDTASFYQRALDEPRRLP